MKQITLFIIVIFFTIPASGQKGYYYTDCSIISGIELLKKGKSNTYFCYVKDNVIKYTPFEVSEYSFKGGDIYKSFYIIINIQLVLSISFTNYQIR